MGLCIEQVMSEIENQWININGVEGIGKGKLDGNDCIEVFVSIKTPEIEKTIPQEYKGFTVRLIEIGGVISAEEPKQKDSC